MIKRIGAVAYKIDLPVGAKIRLVFHMSLLKKSIKARHMETAVLPEFAEDGMVLLHPIKLLARCIVKLKIVLALKFW